MKLGIKRIEYIPTSNCHSWVHVGRNDSINIDNFIDSEYTELEFAPFIQDAFKELKFTDLTATLEEEWINDTPGIYSKVSVTGVVRSKKDRIKNTLPLLLKKKNIFRVTAINGEKYIVGSIEAVPKVLFKLIVNNIDTYEYQISITCKSTHGLIFDIS